MLKSFKLYVKEIFSHPFSFWKMGLLFYSAVQSCQLFGVYLCGICYITDYALEWLVFITVLFDYILYIRKVLFLGTPISNCSCKDIYFICLGMSYLSTMFFCYILSERVVVIKVCVVILSSWSPKKERYITHPCYTWWPVWRLRSTTLSSVDQYVALR